MLPANPRRCQLPREVAHFHGEQQTLRSRHGPLHAQLDYSGLGTRIGGKHVKMVSRWSTASACLHSRRIPQLRTNGRFKKFGRLSIEANAGDFAKDAEVKAVMDKWIVETD
jgi:hypothetical protein